MNSESEAREIIERRIEAGGTLVTAVKADLPAIKKLQDQCLAADIPALIGPCSSGG